MAILAVLQDGSSLNHTRFLHFCKNLVWNLPFCKNLLQVYP